jgi:hypothetical protein
MVLYRKATADEVLKKKAVAQNLGNHTVNDLRLGVAEILAVDESVVTFSDIVDNTTVLFKAWTTQKI